jgi:hypothetical protein
VYENNLSNSINYILKDEIKEKLEFILKENGMYDVKDRYIYKRRKGMQNNINKKGEYFLTENESIINNLIKNSPSNLRKILFNDVDIGEYICSFNSGEYKIEEPYLRELVILLNELELTQWLLLQERIGCRICASYFNKQLINWQPLNTEFLIDKTILNNYEYITRKQIKNVISEYRDKKNGNIVVFSNEPVTLCKGFLQEVDKSDSEDSVTEERISINFTNENVGKIAFPLIFKENFNNYFFDLPFQLYLDKVSSVDNLFQNYYKTAKDLSILKNTDILKKAEVDWNNSKCYPVQYLRNNFLMLEKMDLFLREKQFLL